MQTIIEHSKTMDWREEVEYLGIQMTREQAGLVELEMFKDYLVKRIIRGQI